MSANTELPDPQHLVAVVQAAARNRPEQVLFGRRVDSGWSEVTAREFSDQVTALAKGFIAAGVAVGDRAGLLAKTRYEWTLCDFALWFIAAVPVPIYETSAPDQVSWILADSAAVGCIVESAAQARCLSELAPNLPALRHVWELDNNENPLDQLIALGSDIADDELSARQETLRPSSLATLIYTSGTTGRPKGCMLTHGNFVAECSAAVRTLPELFDRPEASTVLFLPLAHVFGRMIEIAVILAGVKLTHSDPARLLKDLAVAQPTFVLSVPQVFEKIFETARRKAASAGKGAIFDRACDVAIRFSKAQEKGWVSPFLRIQHALFDRLVYRKLRNAFGGRAQFAISGGAPLGARLAHFYTGIGITVLEGYGLTESTAAATANRVKHRKIGTVGLALDGFSVRIEEGEVLLRGGNIFAGYWNDRPGSAPIEWLRTGDLGTLDADGFLTITGRSKEIIVTAGGKNVAPAAIEDAIRAHPLIAQAMLVGDQQSFVGALITLDPEALPSWQAENNAADQQLTELLEHPGLRAEVQRAITAANGKISSAEQVRRFTILPEIWSETSGHLTPTMKLKRSQVAHDFAQEISDLYSQRSGQL